MVENTKTEVQNYIVSDSGIQFQDIRWHLKTAGWPFKTPCFTSQVTHGKRSSKSTVQEVDPVRSGLGKLNPTVGSFISHADVHYPWATDVTGRTSWWFSFSTHCFALLWNLARLFLFLGSGENHLCDKTKVSRISCYIIYNAEGTRWKKTALKNKIKRCCVQSGWNVLFIPPHHPH